MQIGNHRPWMAGIDGTLYIMEYGGQRLRAYLTFEWGLSKPDEQQIKLHNFCELWLLNEDPIQMWSSKAMIAI